MLFLGLLLELLFLRTFGAKEKLLMLLLRSKQLLLHNDLTVGEIAHRVGFADQSHLCRHFKQLTGLTPNQWRS